MSSGKRSLRDMVMTEGGVVLPFGKHPFTREELDTINRLTDYEEYNDSYEHITQGDRSDVHDLWKLTLRTDLDKILDYHPNITSKIEPIIGSEEMFALYRQIDPFSRTLRKIQINLLKEGGFVGPHIDRGSNPQWLFVCVLQLSEHYQGGEYAIDHPDGEKKFKIPDPYGSLFIARTDVDHWIEPVTHGIRKTLVYFVGMDSNPNYNKPMLVEPGEN